MRPLGVVVLCPTVGLSGGPFLPASPRGRNHMLWADRGGSEGRAQAILSALEPREAPHSADAIPALGLRI